MDKDEVIRFLNSLEEGDFLVVEREGYDPEMQPPHYKKTMIICFQGRFIKNGFGEGWHSARAKFMINMGGKFRVDTIFGVEASSNELRKPTSAEMFKLIDEVRKAGFVYNRKTKELINILMK